MESGWISREVLPLDQMIVHPLLATSSDRLQGSHPEYVQPLHHAIWIVPSPRLPKRIRDIREFLQTRFIDGKRFKPLSWCASQYEIQSLIWRALVKVFDDVSWGFLAYSSRK